MRPYKPPTNEALLTKGIRRLLSAAGIFHWKEHGGLGSAPGVPDLVGCYKGCMFAIEVKAPRGRVSPQQQAFIDNINAAGGIAFVAWSIDDVIEGLGLQDRFLIPTTRG
jgi:Holliday junction resolvase